MIDTGASLSHPDLANVVNRRQSAEVVHGEEKDLSSWTTKPLRGDGYVNGSAGVEEYASHGTHVSGLLLPKRATAERWALPAGVLRSMQTT